MTERARPETKSEAKSEAKPEARPEAKPAMIIHGPAINPGAQLVKMIDSDSNMHDGILMRAKADILPVLPANAVIMEAEQVANTPVSIVTEAKKIGQVTSHRGPGLFNGRQFRDNYDQIDWSSKPS